MKIRVILNCNALRASIKIMPFLLINFKVITLNHNSKPNLILMAIEVIKENNKGNKNKGVGDK